MSRKSERTCRESTISRSLRRVSSLRAACAAAADPNAAGGSDADADADANTTHAPAVPRARPGAHLREPDVKPRPLRARGSWKPAVAEAAVDAYGADATSSSAPQLSARRRHHDDNEPIVSARGGDNDNNSDAGNCDYGNDDHAEADDEVVAVEVRPCPDCGRKFNAHSLERHARVCREVFARKRAQFDSQSARLADTGVDQIRVDEVAVEKRELLVAKQKSRHSWKKESGGLRAAMAAARAAAAGQPVPAEVAAAAAAAAAEDDSMVQCPHCSRRFAEASAQRHIPHCAETKARPARLTKGAGKGIGAAARK